MAILRASAHSAVSARPAVRSSIPRRALVTRVRASGEEQAKQRGATSSEVQMERATDTEMKVADNVSKGANNLKDKIGSAADRAQGAAYDAGNAVNNATDAVTSKFANPDSERWQDKAANAGGTEEAEQVKSRVFAQDAEPKKQSAHEKATKTAAEQPQDGKSETGIFGDVADYMVQGNKSNEEKKEGGDVMDNIKRRTGGH